MQIRTSISIPKEVYEKLQELALKKYGRVHGNINKIIIDAIKMWCRKVEGELKK